MKNSTVLIIDEQKFDKLIRKIESVQRKLEQLEIDNSSPHKRKWVSGEFACEYLNVSSRKLQQLRSEGRISFSKTGRKIYYKITDLDEYIEKHGKN